MNVALCVFLWLYIEIIDFWYVIGCEASARNYITSQIDDGVSSRKSIRRNDKHVNI